MKLSKSLRWALLGPAYVHHHALIHRSLSWSRQEVTCYLDKVRSSPPYLTLADETLTKQDYLDGTRSCTHPRARLLCQRVTTGGTTGSPMAFYRDRLLTRQKERAYIDHIWSYVGFEPFDTRVVFRGNVSSRLLEYKWLLNEYVLSPTSLEPEAKSGILRKLQSLPPFFLHVYPSSVRTLISFLGEDEFARLPIRGVFGGLGTHACFANSNAS